MQKSPIKIYYAGIGSRETPEAVQAFFTKIAKRFAEQGFILRSGGAIGADMAFEKGCDDADGEKEIFLSWKNLNGSDSPLIVTSNEALVIAERFHPRWHTLSEKAKKLQARNVHQVLGWDLKTPTDFITCWTKYKDGKPVGGTTQALRIAHEYHIPVFNAGLYGNVKDIKRVLYNFIRTIAIIDVNVIFPDYVDKEGDANEYR